MSSMGEKTIVVSLTCSKGTDTMVKLCDIFESLNLKIITATITAFSGRLLKTVFIEVIQSYLFPLFHSSFSYGILCALFIKIFLLQRFYRPCYNNKRCSFHRPQLFGTKRVLINVKYNYM